MSTILSFDDLKVALDLNNATFADYPDLQLVADSVHDSLEEYTRRKLSTVGKETETDFLVGTDIDLFNIPVTSVTSVKIDGVETTEYSLSRTGIKLDAEMDGSWEVISKGGWKTIPADIYRAELMQTIYEFQNLNNLAVKSLTNDSGSTQTNEGFAILKDVARLLNKYVHVSKLGF